MHILQNLQNGTSGLSTEWLIALFSSLLALITLISNIVYRRRELRERKRLENIRLLRKKLDEFYGPLMIYLNVVKAIYKIFRSNKPNNFRTLTYLMNPDQEYETDLGREIVVLSESDIQLIEEIIEYEELIESLIIEKAGLIDDESLMFNYIPDSQITDVRLDRISLISVALAHFRILRLAYKGHYQGEAERFKNLVYPRELDIQINNRINEIQEEIANLQKL